MSHVPKGCIVFALSVTTAELVTLRDVLEEEIDRNGKEYPEINKNCQNILCQLPSGKSRGFITAEEELDMIKKIFAEDGLSSSEMLERIHDIIT